MKIKRLKEKYFSYEGALFRYSLSYCLLLAVMPVILIIYYFYMDKPVFAFFYQLLPDAFINGYLDYLSGQQQENMVTMISSFLFAGFISSKVFYSFMLLMMKEEKYELSLWIVRIKAFFSFLFFMICLFVVGIVFRLFQLYSLTFLLVFVVFYLFYRLLSFEKKRWYYGIIGAGAVSGAIIMMGYLFLWYIDHFTSYERFYGSFGVLFALYLSMYVLSCIFYLGHCLNVIFEKEDRQIVYKHDRLYRKIDEIIDHFHL